MWKVLLVVMMTSGPSGAPSLSTIDPFPDAVYKQLSDCDFIGKAAGDYFHMNTTQNVTVGWTCVPFFSDPVKIREASKAPGE